MTLSVGTSDIGVLGYGRFGRALGILLREANHTIRAFDPNSTVPPQIRVDSPKALALSCRRLIVAVPVAALAPCLESLKPYLTKDHVVMDVGSVKVEPSRTLEQALGTEVPWVATHPLFGPASLARGERALVAVVCPNALHPEAATSAKRLYEDVGCRVIEQSPEAHDRRMAETHALAFFIAKALIDLGVHEKDALTPPSFRAMARSIEAVRSDAGHLFATIEQANPFAKEVREAFIAALERIDKQILEPQSQKTADEKNLTIPDLGARSPELLKARQFIDELDEGLVDLLARRMQLSKRAGRAKAEQGQPVRDPTRERELMEQRAKWAKARGLEEDAVVEIFETILRHSRLCQTT